MVHTPHFVNPELMESFTALSRQEGLLPVKVSPSYRRLVEEEVGAIGTSGPLYRIVYPTAERLTLTAPGEVGDFVGDKGNMAMGSEGVLIQKYRDRVLFLGTAICFAHCAYCFRTQLLSEEHEGTASLPDLKEKVDTLTHVLNDKPEVTEVIFSGGDPLVLGKRNLGMVFERIRSVRPDVNLRVHTRAAAYSPHNFTDGMAGLFGEYDVRVYHHITHPYEVGDDQKTAFQRLRANDVRQYNQCPIIRGVNDHPDVLKQLIRTLDAERVRQVNFFIADPIKYGAGFRIPLRYLFDTVDEVNWTSPSWVNSVRLVLDTPFGKVRREDISAWNDDGTVTFQREGNRVVYPDLPPEQYEQTSTEKLLWRRNQA